MSGTLYACFDFRFASDIPLGELTTAAADDEREIVGIRLGEVADTLHGATEPQFGLQAIGDTALLIVPGVGRYLIRNGREIIVSPETDASERNVRLFLLGSALGILAYQRRILPIHANAIVVEGGAYAFSGPSGAGKSTLAAHFAAAGFEVLCDDVCGVTFDPDGTPIAWPGLPRLKLWQDAARAFGHDPAALDRAIEGQEKFHVAIDETHGVRPVPLRRLYTLARAEDGKPGTIVRRKGSEAMGTVMTNTYRGEYLATLGLTAWHFARSAEMLRRIAVFEVSRAWGYDVFQQEAARLVAHVAAPA